MSKPKKPSARRGRPTLKVTLPTEVTNPKRITSYDLKVQYVPKPDASIFEFEDFAYTYNAYEEHPTLSAVYRITKERRHNTLDQLRTCLFVEFRDTWRLGPVQFDEESEEVQYLRLLIQKIRLALSARDVIRLALDKRAEEDE